MANQKDNEKESLYNLLRSRGFDPVMRDTTGSTVPVSNDAEVFQFNFDAEGEAAPVTVSIDEDNKLVIYYGDDVKETGSEESWYSLLKELKHFAQQHQLSFQLKNKDHLRYDMAKRTHMKQVDEGSIQKSVEGQLSEISGNLATKVAKERLHQVMTSPHNMDSPEYKKLQGKTRTDFEYKRKKEAAAKKIGRAASKDAYNTAMAGGAKKVDEGYYPTGRKSSYSDNIPEVKIILQHSRALEEGERRYRAVEKIFVENQQGERFAVPTTKPGLARVYARHIAEGGTPYDEAGKHITALCEEYSKMAGFVRATRNKQFNESAQSLVNEGINHYQKLRESLHKLSTHRGYHAFFESWTPTLMEDDTDATDLSEMFASTELDPRIESVMPILRKLNKTITEVDHTAELAEWADGVIDESLGVQLDELSPNALINYKAGAEHDKAAASGTIKHGAMFSHKDDPVRKALNKWDKRNKGTKRADARLDRTDDPYDQDDPAPMEEGINEVSNDLLGRYKKKAGKEASGLDTFANAVAKKGEDPAFKRAADWATKRANKRFSGIVKATNKEFANDTKQVEEDNTENVAINPEGIPEATQYGLSQHSKKFVLSKLNSGDWESSYDVQPGRSLEIIDRRHGDKRRTIMVKSDFNQATRDFNHAKRMGNLPESETWTDNMGGKHIVYDRDNDNGELGAEKEGALARERMKKKDPSLNQSPHERHDKEYFDRLLSKKKDTEVKEDLGPEQKKVGQLGPQEKVGPQGAVGKLVGANESLNRRAFLKGAGVAAAVGAAGAAGVGISKLNDHSKKQEAEFLSHITDEFDLQNYKKAKDEYLSWAGASNYGQGGFGPVKNPALTLNYLNASSKFEEIKSALRRKYNILDEESESVQLDEYHAKGTVNGKRFAIATDDAYDAAQIMSQNPHLSPDEARAIEAHTETDEFIDGNQGHSSQHGSHIVQSTSGGYHGDFSDSQDVTHRGLDEALAHIVKLSKG